MGRGDKKTKKGKIAIGSYGNSRKRNAVKAKSRKAAQAAGGSGASADAPAKPKRTARKKSES